jgi:hypothetical protein
MKVYIAAKYSADTPEEITLNVRTAIAAGEQIAKAGHLVFIPHLDHFWEKYYPHDYEFWLWQTSAWLEVCQALVRLSGESKGADREVHRARSVLHIPVYFGVEDFLNEKKQTASVSLD